MFKRKKKIYLDCAASTPTDPQVIKKMNEILSGQYYGNPSSLHTHGRTAYKVLDTARREVAGVLGVKKDTIFFTGSGTEADNMALFGIAYAYKHKGKHIITTAIEHKAVLQATKRLEEGGFEVTYLPVNGQGLVEKETLKNALRDDTILVSIMHANNEIGVIQDMKMLSQTIQEFRKKKPKHTETPLFHTDACQSASLETIHPDTLGVDVMTLNGSKLYGPKGVGCLYIKGNVRLSPTIIGGGQEKGLRAGTENIAGIVGFAEALILAGKYKEKEKKRLTKLRDYFFERIEKEFEKCVINGDKKKRLANNINVSFLGLEGEALVLWLDTHGISVATGSACTAKDLAPSHVISALDPNPFRAHGSLRITLGKYTTKKDLDYTLKKLHDVVTKLRAITSAEI